tara:strand:+ start:145 stop:498 length:354 start_codon:yes stop_codon:yes gene_type:complete
MSKILHKRSIDHHPDCVEEYWITHTCNIKIPLERLKIEEPDGEIWYDFNEDLTKEEIEQGFIYFSENTLTLHGTQSTRDYITACIDNINSKFDLNLKRKDCKVSNHKEDVYHEYVWK